MTKEERINAVESKEKSLTHFMDEVALIEIRAVSPNHNWDDWADWHRYLYPSTAQSFKAFREAAERYAKHRVEQAISDIKGAEAEAESKSKELSEKTLALGNAYRLLKLLDNTIGLTEPQRKRMEQINYTITKYFDATECLRITPSALDTPLNKQ